MRFGPVGANTGLLILALLSISGAVRGLGPFAGGAAADNVLSLQLFLIAVSVPVMFLATAIEERRAAEGRPRQVLEAAPNAMVMMTQEGEITLVNTAVEVVFGYDREELIGRSIDVLIPDWLSILDPSHREGTSPPQEHARWGRGGNCSVDVRTAARSRSKSASRPSRPRKRNSSWLRFSTSRSGNMRSTRCSAIARSWPT